MLKNTVGKLMEVNYEQRLISNFVQVITQQGSPVKMLVGNILYNLVNFDTVRSDIEALPKS